MPVLDHYLPTVRGDAAHYCRPLELVSASSGPSLPVWPGNAGAQRTRILAYLKAAHPLTLPLLNALAQHHCQPPISALVYAEDAQEIGNPHANIHIQNTPLPFRALLQGSPLQPGAQLVIHQGGIGASSQALLAGVPQLLLPDMAEAFITARTLVRQGVAELLRPEASRELLIQTLGQIINGARYGERAAVLAQQNMLPAGNNEAFMWRKLIELFSGAACC